MKNDGPFMAEAKALESVINNLYAEQKCLSQRIDTMEEHPKDRAQLEIINHFINLYERF